MWGRAQWLQEQWVHRRRRQCDRGREENAFTARAEQGAKGGEGPRGSGDHAKLSPPQNKLLFQAFSLPVFVALPFSLSSLSLRQRTPVWDACWGTSVLTFRPRDNAGEESLGERDSRCCSLPHLGLLNFQDFDDTRNFPHVFTGLEEPLKSVRGEEWGLREL